MIESGSVFQAEKTENVKTLRQENQHGVQCAYSGVGSGRVQDMKSKR